MPVGAYVTEVTANGAGSRAGLQVGDIITRIDDTDITSREDLLEAKMEYSAGDTVRLVVYRNGEYLTLSLTFDDENAQLEESVQSIPYSTGGFPS